jgi:fatty acid desaturase
MKKALTIDANNREPTAKVNDKYDNNRHDRGEWRRRIALLRREVRSGLDVKKYEGPAPIGSVMLAVGAQAAIVVAGCVTYAAWDLFGSLGGAAAYMAALPVIAREQRVLELLVHDGSHGAFSRKRWLNEWLCNVVAAAPVVQLTAHYWRTHKIHHQQFGSDLDPCRDRMFMGSDRGTGLWAWLRAVLKAMPAYLRDYYGGVASTSSRPVLAALAWHGGAMLLLAAAIGWSMALACWLLFWALPFGFVLPVIRMQAESDEHDYGLLCEASGTFTNLGPANALLVHPAGDIYHLAHHAFPAIPAVRLRRFDWAARKVSAIYRAMPTRHR